MLTLDEERRMLARLVAAANDPGRAAIRDAIAASIPTGLADQRAAAARDVARRLGTIADRRPDYHGPHTIDTPSVGVVAHFDALVLRCLAAHACRHAADADRPMHVCAAARVISCAACLPRYRHVLAAADHAATTGTDTVCDLCLDDVTDHQFTPHVATLGPALIVAAVCTDCRTMLAHEHASAS